MLLTAKTLGLNLLVCSALLLAGCSTTSPPTRYYQLEPMQLDPMAQQQGRENSNTKLLAVGPVYVPEYLDRPQLVIRTASVEIVLDDFRHWAEPLDSALPRVLAGNIGALKKGLAALDHRHDSFLQFDYRLLADIHQFDVDQGGRVLLQVRWWVQDDRGNTLIPSTSGRYQVEARNPSDTASSVEAMNRALELFSRDIAQALDAAAEEI